MYDNITSALLAYGETVPTAALFPTVVPEAASLVTTNPYAFCVAACLDRGTKAEIIWTIPYDIRTTLGHIAPLRLRAFSQGQWAALLRHLPRRPRYINAAPRTLYELTRLVVDRHAGDAAQIWEGKRAWQVKRTLQSIYGVGPGIANMTVLLIEKAFRIHFPDRQNIDIKPDVHTVRVLYRLGVSTAPTEQAAIVASRAMNPDFPGVVDAALWYLGRMYCFAIAPQCAECPMETLCAKRIEALPK